MYKVRCNRILASKSFSRDCGPLLCEPTMVQRYKGLMHEKGAVVHLENVTAKMG